MRLRSSFIHLALIILALAARPITAQDACTGFWRTFSLGAGRVTAIAAAPDGRLFVGVKDGGLRIYGPDSSGAYVWRTVVSGRGSGLASNAVAALAVEGDELWIGTDDAGASVLNLSDGLWRTYDASSSGLPSDRIRRITPASNLHYRQVWLSTPRGAVRYSKRRLLNTVSWRTVGAADGMFDEDVRDVAVHVAGSTTTVWIASSKELFTWAGGQLHHVDATFACSFDTASRMAADRWNRVWLGSLRDEPDGLVPRGVCSFASRGLDNWEHFPDLAPRYVWDMSSDSAGRVWLAVDGGGAVHDQGTWCFYSRPEVPLYSNNLSSVAAAGEGVWFGHRDARALTFHSPNWDRLYLGSAAEASGTPRALFLEGSTLWIGVGTGIAWGSGEAWSFTAIPGNSAPVSALARDGAGKLWIGTAGNGLYALDGGTFEHHLGGGLPHADVRALAVDGSGRLWVATAQGLALRGAGYWLAFTSASSPLSSDDLRALAADGAGRLWIGTGSAGIQVLEATGDAAGAWSKEDTSTGLPANAVRGLAVEPSGAVWAATSAGAGRRDPATGAWTAYDSKGGALPSDSALCVASDPGGRVWVGTVKGLARKEGDSWQHFHVTSSTLESDRVLALAASSDQVWAAAGKWVAARSDVTGPIGHFPPEIASFSPAGGPPGSSVTINGSGFDDRGPSYNRVTFGTHPAGALGYPPAAEVLSVTSSKLVVRVPALATSGKIKVVAHHLSAESAAQFTVRPAITGISPTCLGVGGELTIEGGGFLGAGGGQWPQIQIGNGDLRALDPGFDSVTATHILYRVRQGDAGGRVRVRLPSGQEVVSSGEVSIGSLLIKRTRVRQGVEYGLPLVWGKRTLVHMDFEAEGCETQITGGTFYWKKKDGKKKDGTLLRGSSGYQVSPGSQPVEVSFSQPAVVDDTRGLDFVAEFSSNRSGWSEQFPLSEFDGGRIVIVNRGIEVLATDVDPFLFPFEDPGTPLKVRCMAVFPEEGQPSTPAKEFWRRAVEGMQHVARMYPQADIGALHGPGVWLGHTSTYIRRSGPIDLDDDDQYCDVKGAVDDYLDPDDDTIGIALVDDMLLAPGDPPGKAPIDSLGSTGVVFNGDGWAGRVMAHEAGHVTGLVDEDAANHDSGNEGHSRYDEGDFTNSCVGSLSYRQSLIDQGVADFWRVYRLDSGAPFRFSRMSCAANRPKSVMSYAPNRDNYNTFLEKIDYNHIRGVVQALGQGGGGGGAGGAALAEDAGSGGGATAYFLRLKGVLE
ncbi:MAG: IPT/TIG domain-containing protein, partial [Planctomycetes bacterium]|nr:IPT/TIG domain-containing protein [Planctomycetota bacterium]